MVVVPRHVRSATAVALLLSTGLCSGTLQAETLTDALARTYATNPTINADRARQRAIDEAVPQALANYRPTVVGSADAGVQRSVTTFSSGGAGSRTEGTTTTPRGAGLTVQQNIFRGFRTQNEVKRAEANVFAGREALRDTEQDVLLTAVQAYMNTVRDTAILEIRRGNVIFLEETLRATQDRFNVGEVTRTDVAQAEASLARGRSDLSLAEANLSASRASFRQIVGIDPRNLVPPQPVERLVPKTVETSIATARREHPQILSSSLIVDAAQYDVKIQEGALLPTATVQGDVNQRFGSSEAIDNTLSASLTARVDVPLYQGGAEYSAIRQAKETLGQRKLELDLAREQVQAAVVTSFFDLASSQALVVASQAEVNANEIALRGVQEEARVGQRTTLDVLDAQQDLLNSRERFISAQRDRVVASYSLLASIGRFGVDRLGLPARKYQPEKHYDEVRDKWAGVRTPGGQ